jgi:hypothetical protein
MPLVKCSECKKDLSTTADSCPSCGSKNPFKDVILTAAESKSMSYKEKMNFQKLGGKLIWSTSNKIGAVIFLIFIVFLIKQCNAPLSPEEQAKKDKESLISSARTTCKYHLEKQLNDPESIEYGKEPLDKVVFEEDPGKWVVALNFRAKNKFNALVQSKVMCELNHNGEKFDLVKIKQIK